MSAAPHYLIPGLTGRADGLAFIDSVTPLLIITSVLLARLA